MASDRDKLALDEQSFEGLLAAAFTIQQHNARMNAAGDPPHKNESADQASPATPEEKLDAIICGGCDAVLPSAGATCQKCGRTNFRPGERLQRNWASLWQMSQEQGTGLEARRKPEDELAVSPADPSRIAAVPHAGSEIPETFNHAHPDTASQNASSVTEHATPPSLRIQAAEHQTDGFVFPENSAEPAETRTLAFAREDEAGPEEAAEISASDAAENDAAPSSESSHHDEEIARDSTAVRDDPGAEEQALVQDETFLSDVSVDRDGQTEESWRQATPHAGANIFTVLRARVAAHRADIFLALAVIIAAGALLWPTGGESGPKMAPWERALVAVGIAEAPRPVVHFYGDPNLKVWVDTHTALYYCPGDELYGKSPDGHYTTQRAAQADQFEPAQRSVCIE